MLSDSVGPSHVSWQLGGRRGRGVWDGTHGECCDVPDDGGGHRFGAIPDGITEEKPSGGESVGGGQLVAAEGGGD
jgi:hypothetical protein